MVRGKSNFLAFPLQCTTKDGYALNENQQAIKDPLYIPVGPITRVRSKKIKETLNGLI